MAYDMRGQAVIEVENELDEQPLVVPDGVRVTWLHRVRGQRLVPSIRSMTIAADHPDVFVHGEGAAIGELRRHLLVERGVPRRSLSISGYWRSGLNDEAWRAVKAIDAAHR
jgi:NADPH-dependent ferric siderophore reductase